MNDHNFAYVCNFISWFCNNFVSDVKWLSRFIYIAKKSQISIKYFRNIFLLNPLEVFKKTRCCGFFKTGSFTTVFAIQRNRKCTEMRVTFVKFRATCLYICCYMLWIWEFWWLIGISYNPSYPAITILLWEDGTTVHYGLVASTPVSGRKICLKTQNDWNIHGAKWHWFTTMSRFMFYINWL